MSACALHQLSLSMLGSSTHGTCMPSPDWHFSGFPTSEADPAHGLSLPILLEKRSCRWRQNTVGFHVVSKSAKAVDRRTRGGAPRADPPGKVLLPWVLPAGLPTACLYHVVLSPILLLEQLLTTCLFLNSC